MTTKNQFQDDSISLTGEQFTIPKIKMARRSLMPNFGSTIQKPTLRKTAQSCPAMSPQKSKRILPRVFSKCSIKPYEESKFKNSNPIKNLKRRLSCSIQNVKYATRRSKSAKITTVKEMGSDVFCGESSNRRSIETRNRILSVKEEEIEDVIIWEETFIPKKKRSRISFLRRWNLSRKDAFYIFIATLYICSKTDNKVIIKKINVNLIYL